MIILTETTEITFFENILHIKVLEGADFTLANTIKDRVVVREILGDRKLPVIIDASAHFCVTEEGREFAATDEANYNRSAVAYVCASASSILHLRHYLSLNQPNVPSKIFKTRDEAMCWLEEVTVQKEA